MTPEVADWWQRAVRALKTAAGVVDEDPDAAASRAYYAAFYAASSLFALEGRSFKKHAQLEAAVHHDLVKSGRWPTELGAAYSWLASLRYTGDYGGGTHVTVDEARAAAEKAGAILDAVRGAVGGPPEP